MIPRFTFFPQVCQVSAQQPIQTELLMRHHQLQSRLATLKIENEEVSGSLHRNLKWGLSQLVFCK